MTLFLLLLAAGIAIAFAYHYGRRSSAREFDADERSRQLQQMTVDLSEKLNKAEAELARKRELAEQIPLLVSKLAQELPQEFLPPLAVRFAKKFFGATRVGYFVPVEGAPDYTLEVGVGFPADWPGKVRIASDDGLLGLAIRNKIVAARREPAASSGTESAGQSLERCGVEPDFVAPVIGISGIAGALVIAGCPFPGDEERANVSMLADLLSGAMQKAALAELSKSSTWVDPLTGVANRLYFARRFESELRRAQNYHQSLGLVMLDIDDFKKINDTYGHPAGDLVIKKFAELVRSVTRSSDLVCRYGGDEFMVLVTTSNDQQVLAYAEKLVRTISATDVLVPRHGTLIRLTTSGGLAMFPEDGQSATELLHAADDALYEAKRQGRNRIVLSHSLSRQESGAEAAGPYPEAGGEAVVKVPAPRLQN